ncbi:MAG: hypothetical protein A7316_08810 [Candidatus Altiarchaeales archaeon WOR_SM1_86-2]|nr:MAG: hypothetical protein A7316_08810 [Candidatus Altiarchaeales archaeon WOR_SM1_86-2]
MIKLSELHGKSVYTDKGAGYIGKVADVLLNAKDGEIMKLTTEGISTTMPRDEVERILHEKGIDYKDVKEVGDIIIVEPR